MKTVLSVTAICVALALVSLPLAYGQQTPQAEKTFQGELTKVDASAMKISVKGAGDAEMIFAHNDHTHVVGQKDTQGLAAQPGTQLRVTYREVSADNRIATKIEIVDKK